jgi:hypothetical protein
MATQEEIWQQQQLLNIYRQNLAHSLRQQAAQGGEIHASPATANSIHNAREDIERVKNILSSWGIPVEDHPDDKHQWPSAPPSGKSMGRIRKPPESLQATRSSKRKLADAGKPPSTSAENQMRSDVDSYGLRHDEQQPLKATKQELSAGAIWLAQIMEKLGEAPSKLEEKLKVLPYFWNVLEVEKPANEDIHIAVFFAGHMLATRASLDNIRAIEEDIQSERYIRRDISQSIRRHVTKMRARNASLEVALTVVPNYSNSIAISKAVHETQSCAKDIIDTFLKCINETEINSEILLRLGFIAIALEDLEHELKSVCDELIDSISEVTGKPFDIQVKMITPEPSGRTRLS